MEVAMELPCDFHFGNSGCKFLIHGNFFKYPKFRFRG